MRTNKTVSDPNDQII